ncbi:MAG: TRAP transporter substrate-binding protein DctP, partial [Acidobacteriota bacterium]
LGGAPTPISWGELYTALQQGVVDGAENNPPSFHLSRHYEVARFYSLDEHTSVPDVLLVSGEVWGRLGADEQDWLQRAADASAQVQRRLWREAEEEALEAVQAAGVEVVRPPKAPFQERTRQLLEAYADRPDLMALVEEIRGLETRGAPAP